ncbi:hypothetical protein F383_11743 [Gossypium arboreum]|uniref:Uncharacterized protein n=1 Tax=Gossypium arboreum TaxID=29729 RepID=A0A0B0PSI8_GOSAR|nr:hypothetical protein F383_12510 [Gossypium arboreum]KHG30201.1 hypothetical protein F383_11743 [Gossypium arboreum]
MRTGYGRGVRGLWRYGTVVVGVWGCFMVVAQNKKKGGPRVAEMFCVLG